MGQCLQCVFVDIILSETRESQAHPKATSTELKKNWKNEWIICELPNF